MTAVTVDQKHDNIVYDVELVNLDVDEGYTYTTRISHPIGVQLTVREDSDAIVNYEISGKVITFHESSGSGVKVFAVIYGRK